MRLPVGRLAAACLSTCLSVASFAQAGPAAAQDIRNVALEIDRYARVCLGASAGDPRTIKLLSVSADEKDQVASSHQARSLIALLEGELSRFDSITIIDPRAFGASLDTIWDLWRKQSNLVSLAWDKIAVDIVLLPQSSPVPDRRDGLRFIVHNPRSGCTKYVGPLPVALSPAPEPRPPPSAPPPTAIAPACGWYAIAFCRPHGNEAEVREWNARNARAQVIDTSSAAYPNFTRGWFCVASGPHDKAVAASIETRWKANGWNTSYIKEACKK